MSPALIDLLSYMQAPEGVSLNLEFLSKASPGLESEIARAIAIDFN